MQNQIPPVLQSSTGSGEMSLFIESLGHVVISLVAFYAAYKGLDSQAITSNLQLIIASVATIVPIAWGTWKSILMVWGLIRKVLILLSKPQV